MQKVIGVVLAAGKDNKLVHKIYGKEIIKRTVESLSNSNIVDILAVVGDKKETIKEVLQESVKYFVQEEQLGSAHALMQVKEYLKNKTGKVVVLNGDLPLLRSETIQKVVDQNIKNNELATILTAKFNNSQVPLNVGVCCFDIEQLIIALEEVKPNEENGKYYMAELIKVLENKNLKIGKQLVEDYTEVLEVQNLVQLEMLTRILRMRINTEYMNNGVIIEDINTTYIYDDVKIGKDTVIHPNTTIKSNVEIGQNCEIGPNSYIREGSKLSNKVKIGSFVEIKKVIVGEGSKIPHLSYIGDCEIGKNCNIGCGAITCNYDGVNKHKTIIGDNCFIGSNVNLIAPVEVKSNSFIGAGSTINRDVPEYALGIAREKQINLENWNKKRI